MDAEIMFTFLDKESGKECTTVGARRMYFIWDWKIAAVCICYGSSRYPYFGSVSVYLLSNCLISPLFSLNDFLVSLS